MKKAIIGISGLLIFAFAIIFTVEAQKSNKQEKKAVTTVTQEVKAPAKCCATSDSKTASADAVKGPVMKCDMATMKTEKCDPATCKDMKCDPAKCKGGKCDPATCKTNCSAMASEMKCNPANCNK